MTIGQTTAARTLALCLKGWDRVYRQYHHLRPVGPLLLVGFQRYTGVERRFPDATVLVPGDRIATLHFNNARIASLGHGQSRHLTAWQFTRLLRESLEALASFSASAEADSIAVYEGTTWMQSHGFRVGFVTEPLSQGWRAQLLRLHFRMLRACFAPADFRRKSGAIAPRNFWITRTQLQTNFGRAPP